MKRMKLLLALYLLSVSVCASAQWNDKTIGIVVFDGVLSSDVVAPLEVFGAASRQSWFSDYSVVTIGIGDSVMIETEEGLRLGVDYSINNAPDLDVLIVPSRYDMSKLLANEGLLDFIRARSKQVQWLSSNCSGALLLAQAGLLEGKRATTWAGGEKDMQRDFPSVHVQYDVNFVVDGNVLTSNGGLVSYQAALKLLEEISSPSRAKEIKEALQLNRL